MVTSYVGWVADGRPWKNCTPINDFIATLRRHGYTGPSAGIGDQAHLTANPPEDHCPYSHTPWPGIQPYSYVLAIDIMPNEGVDWIWLGQQLFNDKNSNKPGTEPIKYMNWTDSHSTCFHDSWMPNHTRVFSTDRGHIHISFRTDYVTSNRMAIYDPWGDAMTNEEFNLIWATGWLVQRGIIELQDPVVVPANPGSSYGGFTAPNKLKQALDAATVAGGLTPEQIAALMTAFTAAAKEGATQALSGATVDLTGGITSG